MKVIGNDGRERHLSEETLWALRRGTLEIRERLRALEHMESCPACAEAFADLISAGKLIPPAPDFSVRPTKSSEQRKKELRRYTARVSAAACAALMLVASQMWMTLSSDQGFLTGMGMDSITEMTEKGSAAGVERVEKMMDSIRGISDRVVNWGGENSNDSKEK